MRGVSLPFAWRGVPSSRGYFCTLPGGGYHYMGGPLIRGIMVRGAGERGMTHKKKSPRTRATHTHKIHDDTTGPECGDCMLVDEVVAQRPLGD